MEISAGVIIINKRGQILACRPNGRSKQDPNGFDIPKGHIEPGETPEEAARREVKEETGIDLKGVKLEDFGQHPYIKNKDLHIFKCEYDVKVEKLFCDSYFERYGKQWPEIIGYEWVDPLDVTSKFYKSLFPIIIKFI